jgi:hypothetical protein
MDKKLAVRRKQRLLDQENERLQRQAAELAMAEADAIKQAREREEEEERKRKEEEAELAFGVDDSDSDSETGSGSGTDRVARGDDEHRGGAGESDSLLAIAMGAQGLAVDVNSLPSPALSWLSPGARPPSVESVESPDVDASGRASPSRLSPQKRNPHAMNPSQFTSLP